MAMIFPGMDPYLEHPDTWPGVHNGLIVYIRDQLRPRLRPRYTAAIDARIYIEGRDERLMVPDVLVRSKRGKSGGTAVLEPDTPITVEVSELEINESMIHILDRTAGNKVVAVIEVLSPPNKCAGPGRDLYVRKQQAVLNSQAHLIEIDLLRTGPHVLAVAEYEIDRLRPFDYLVSVNRALGGRTVFQLYPRTLRQRLSRLLIPLVPPDKDVVLDLQAAVARTYEAGDYRTTLRYDSPCFPPLRATDQAWAESLIRSRAARAKLKSRRRSK